MSDNNGNELLELVNLSGYPLQIGLEYAVKQTYQMHQWSVVGREHFWASPELKKEGFIDIILSRYNLRMVVECKRVLDQDWIFLVTDRKKFNVRKSKLLRSNINSSNSNYEWLDFNLLPETFESPFCIMGRDRDRPSIEKLSSDLLMSVESLANEEISIMQFHPPVSAVELGYVPVIVTTAELHTCIFNPSDVNIDDGKVSTTSKFERVEIVRFRKGLSTANLDSLQLAHDLGESNKANERTVYIIHAGKFVDFLCKFQDA